MIHTNLYLGTRHSTLGMVQVVHTNFNITINVDNTVGVNEWKICTLWIRKSAHMHSRDRYNLPKVVGLQKLYTKQCISVLRNITVVRIVEAAVCRRRRTRIANVRQTDRQTNRIYSTLQVMKEEKINSYNFGINIPGHINELLKSILRMGDSVNLSNNPSCTV